MGAMEGNIDPIITENKTPQVKQKSLLSPPGQKLASS